MELQVWVDNIPRIVCAVVETTTAEEVIRTLLESLHMSGYYSLVAYWKGNEIRLSPNEMPLSFIAKLGDHPTQFEFVLRRIEDPSKSSNICKPISRPSSNTPNTFTRRTVTPQSPASPYKDSKFQRPEKHKSSQDRLHEQVASQEREVEMNRIKLSQLENEIERLEAIAALTGKSPVSGCASTFDPTNGNPNANLIGQAAELAQLASVDWDQQLEVQRKAHHKLLDERGEYQLRLKNLDEKLTNTRVTLTNLESELAREVTRLFDCLDSSVSHRRLLLASLRQNEFRSSTTTPSSVCQTTLAFPTSSTSDGMMI